jgi:non-canonical (house-cleaning) NTP pyrophosphatase
LDATRQALRQIRIETELVDQNYPSTKKTQPLGTLAPEVCEIETNTYL